MAINTYATLKDSIVSWSKNSGSQVLARVDDFIDLAEADIWERLRIRDMEVNSTLTASTASRFLALPTGYLSMRRVSIVSGAERYELESTTPDSMKVVSGSGRPRFFTVTSQIEFDRTPDFAYSVEVQHFASLTALSGSNTTNAVLTRFPMIYLYGSLFHYANWAMNDAMAAKYGELFLGAIDSANQIDKRGRHTPGASMRIQGPTP